MKIGTKIKNFTLKDGYGKLHSLSDYSGKVVVIYIYPKNHTPGCSAQTCGFNDSLALYKARDIVLLGISKDSEESHLSFQTKFSLGFPTLSDPTLEVINYFGAWDKKSLFGKSFLGVKRMTFILNKEGILVYKMEKVNAKDNAKDVLTIIDELRL